jgi:hypothetical protein
MPTQVGEDGMGEALAIQAVVGQVDFGQFDIGRIYVGRITHSGKLNVASGP